jgi:hypothetical protein
LSKHHEVGVKPDALNPAHPQYGDGVMMLNPTELALDGGAATVEPAPLVAPAQDAGLR